MSYLPSSVRSRSKSPQKRTESLSLDEIHLHNEEQNMKGLLTNLAKAARYPGLELRGLMASMTDSAIDMMKTNTPGSLLSKESTEEELPMSLPNLQKASRNSVLELRGMLASINSITSSFHLDEIQEEQDVQGLLDNLVKASETSDMELRGMLASLEFDDDNDNNNTPEKRKQSYMRIQKISRDSFFELRGLLVGLEKVAKNGSANKLSQSIREQLTLQPLDESKEEY